MGLPDCLSCFLPIPPKQQYLKMGNKAGQYCCCLSEGLQPTFWVFWRSWKDTQSFYQSAGTQAALKADRGQRLSCCSGRMVANCMLHAAACLPQALPRRCAAYLQYSLALGRAVVDQHQSLLSLVSQNLPRMSWSSVWLPCWDDSSLWNCIRIVTKAKAVLNTSRRSFWSSAVVLRNPNILLNLTTFS